jgi:hypothetical protein
MPEPTAEADPIRLGGFSTAGILPLPVSVGPATATRPGLATPGEHSHGGYYPPWVIGGWPFPVPVPGAPGVPHPGTWNPPGTIPGTQNPPVVVPGVPPIVVPGTVVRPVVIPALRTVIGPRSKAIARASVNYRAARPTTKRTRELKLQVRSAYRAVAGALAIMTEPCDLIDDMHRALTAPDTKGFKRGVGLGISSPGVKGVIGSDPSSRWHLGRKYDPQMQKILFKRRGYRSATCQDKLNELYEWHGNMDAGVAMENFLLNQLSDIIYGTIGRIGGKASASHGIRTGRLGGFQSGPLH